MQRAPVFSEEEAVVFACPLSGVTGRSKLFALGEASLWFGRFTCSTVSAPSRSSTALPTRKRSAASSVACDRLLVAREARKGRKETGPRAKPRSRKGNQRNAKKGTQPGKSLRSSIGVLQNAIVLAPFHTLKRCFQNKLVDLYSHEKTKKVNRKIKMAEKQKMSFEYDIVELNQLGLNVKKEAKSSRPQQKHRSPSYCQCDRTSKLDTKKLLATHRKKKEPDHVFSPQASTFRETKRRKLNTPPLTPNILKAELSPRVDLCSPNPSLPSDTNLSVSRNSLRYKSDISDVSTNSPECRERLTGSLAISTTSFDSYLDHFDRPDCTYPPTAPSTTNRNPTPGFSQPPNPDCLPKPNSNLSRHMIMHNGTKNSDSRIVDFMDREPQSQLISSGESSQHLHPLPRRLSKTRATPTKKTDNATAMGYYLRSLTPGMEPLSPEQRSRGSASRKNRLHQVEVATQVEGSGLEREREGSATRVDDVLREALPASGVLDTLEERPPSEEKGSSQEAKESSSSPREETSEVMVSPAEVEGNEAEGELGQILPEVQGARDSLEVVPELGGRFQASSALEGAQDEEANFIFGPRNAASRLGESCKFSFGLNFVFSDDED